MLQRTSPPRPCKKINLGQARNKRSDRGSNDTGVWLGNRVPAHEEAVLLGNAAPVGAGEVAAALPEDLPIGL